jgi:spermidine synthase
MAAILLGGQLYEGAQGRPLCSVRSFFGVHRVTLDAADNWHQLIHGNTVHGRQSLDPARHGEPLTYYYRSGPAGSVFEVLGTSLGHARVGVIGLGAGSLAAYAGPQQDWTFYEIDPVVEKIARDPAYFTFLRDCRAKQMRVVLGDGRLRLAEAPDHSYDLIALDAFSSDAVPVHLLTREALAVYVRKLARGGILLFHISNRYLDLKPVVARLARDADLIGRFCDDLDVSESEKAAGKEPSQWAIMAASKENLGGLAKSARWQPLGGKLETPVWTDSYSSIIGLFKLD